MTFDLNWLGRRLDVAAAACARALDAQHVRRPHDAAPLPPPCPCTDLFNIFEVFLPQLLLYPNAADPLNGEAASLLLREPERYRLKIKEYVERYGQAAASSSEAAESDDEDAYSCSDCDDE